MLPHDEPQRLKSLHSLDILDTPAEERFDRLTRLVQHSLDVPMATVSLVDADRQWFKSRQGLADAETPRDISFCGHGILDEEIFEIPDALLDSRFFDNPLVTGPPHVRFYAGAPLSTPDGQRVGMLCAISDQPRQLTDRERSVLRDLADCVEAELNALKERRLKALLSDSRARSEAILGAMPDMVILVDRDGACLETNDHPDLVMPRTQLLGRRFDQILPEPVAIRWRRALEKAFSSATVVSFEYELDRPQGKATFEARFQRLNTDETLILIRNVSAESKLQTEVKRLSRLASETTNGVIITGADGRVEWINDGFQRISGFTIEELRGRKPGDVLQGAESDQAVITQMREALARQEGFEVEIINYSKEGRAYWIHILCTPLHDATGTLEGFMAIESDVTAQKRAEEELSQFKETLDQTLDCVFMFDADGLQFSYVNKGATRQVGFSQSELLSMHPYDIKPDIDERQFRELIAPLVSGEKASLTFETWHLQKSGGRIPVEIFLQYITPNNKQARFVAIVRDITERRKAEERIKENEKFLNTILDSIPLPVFHKDADGRYTGFNKAFEVFFGKSLDEMVGRSAFDMHPPELAEIYHAQDLELLRQVGTQTYESSAKNAAGEIREVIFKKATLTDASDQITGLVGTVFDITERKQADAKIHRLAYYDLLTDLPNRRLLQDRLLHAMAVSRRSACHGALIFLDLDDFKVLNDSRGHDAGDRFLVKISKRIRENAREADTVARLGGDEFVLMLENLSPDADEAAAQARYVGEKIRREVSKPVEMVGGPYRCTASLGIALFNGHDESIDALLKQADLAMYKAKEVGRNALRFFDPIMQTSLDERIALESDLRSALDQGQLVPFYQPQVNDSGQVVSAELLLRWQHPERGMVSPAEFIPLAEQTGLILPIGRMVLKQACRQLVAWSQNHALQGLRLAVNVTALELRQSGFVDQVREILEDTGADPTHLTLELTESMVLEDVDDTLDKMEQLRRLGVGFALDDFGTGYSSLAYLTRLPLNTLKVDSSFVFKLPGSQNDAIIVQTIISMARSLGLNVIAEGVETEAQRDFLALHHCHQYQGFLFSRPVPLAQFEQFCRD